ncbi:MAG: hypothetical protein Q4B70_16270 [Lachnospiraceae bacterium]|nr:hypothetical protein [Lachnospiraceae bacterium]
MSLYSQSAEYKKPPGRPTGDNLTGYLKIKLRALGIRVVYQVVGESSVMKIIVVSVCDDEAAYKLAQERIRTRRSLKLN